MRFFSVFLPFSMGFFAYVDFNEHQRSHRTIDTFSADSKRLISSLDDMNRKRLSYLKRKKLCNLWKNPLDPLYKSVCENKNK